VVGTGFLSFFVTVNSPVTDVTAAQIGAILDGYRTGRLTWGQAFPGIDFTGTDLATTPVDFIVGDTAGTRSTLVGLLGFNLAGVPAVGGTASAILATIQASQGAGIGALGISSVTGVTGYTVLLWDSVSVFNTTCGPTAAYLRTTHCGGMCCCITVKTQILLTLPHETNFEAFLEWLNDAEAQRFSFEL
jgi:hypothetical protein